MSSVFAELFGEEFEDYLFQIGCNDAVDTIQKQLEIDDSEFHNWYRDQIVTPQDSLLSRTNAQSSSSSLLLGNNDNDNVSTKPEDIVAWINDPDNSIVDDDEARNAFNVYLDNPSLIKSGNDKPGSGNLRGSVKTAVFFVDDLGNSTLQDDLFNDWVAVDDAYISELFRTNPPLRRSGKTSAADVLLGYVAVVILAIIGLITLRGCYRCLCYSEQSSSKWGTLILYLVFLIYINFPDNF